MAGIYIIAEVGVNHNGSLKTACELVDLAAEAGADAVKFQTFTAAEVISRTAPKAPYQRKLTPPEESQQEMARKLELTAADHKELFEHCRMQGIEFISTPFDLQSVDLLVNTLDVSRLKIASGDITNAPLLLEAARTGKPVLLSTGMSSLGEIETALGVLAFGYTGGTGRPCPAAFRSSYSSRKGQQALQRQVTLLHCTTEYPAPFEDINLLAMGTLKSAFGLRVGYSDHSSGIAVPIAAAALGASVIEKHFTLDRNLPGPDHRASLEPVEFKEMVTAIRQVEKSLGSPVKFAAASELRNLPLVRRSLVARTPIKRGEFFTEENLGVKRPGGGVQPLYYWDYLGKKAGRDYQPDEEIT